MEKELVKKNAQFLAQNFEYELKQFFEKSSLEKLETIQKRLGLSRTKLNPVIDDLIENIKEWETSKNSTDKSDPIEGRLWYEIDFYFQSYLQDLIYFVALQTLLVSPYSPYTSKDRDELREKYSFTSAGLRDEIFKTLRKTYLGTVKHGGDRKEIPDETKQVFFATYNRFKIVIDNALNDVKNLKGKTPAMQIRKEIQTHYQIPDDYIDALITKKIRFDGKFRKASPKEVALYWAQKFMNLSLSIATLDDIEEEMRKYFDKKYPNKILVFADFPDASYKTQTMTFTDQDLKKEIKFNADKRYSERELHFVESKQN